MSNQQKIYNLLKKVEKVQGTKTHKLSQIKKAVKTTTAFGLKLAEMKKNKKAITPKQPKIKLGKIDELEYDYSTTQDEVSRVSYFVEEYFDELFTEAQQAWMVLNDVFKFQSESFWRFEDMVMDDKVKLEEIKELSEELGVDVSDIYPDWQDHYDSINYGLELDEEYDNKEREFNEYFG